MKKIIKFIKFWITTIKYSLYNNHKRVKEENCFDNREVKNDIYCKCGGVKLPESEFCKDCI